MKKSLEIISSGSCPIQVTNYYFEGELEGWIDWFKKKEIETYLKPKGDGSAAVFRKVTLEEVAEIKAGEVIIREGSFKEIRAGDYL